MLDHEKPNGASWTAAKLPLSSMEKLRATDLDEVHMHMTEMLCEHQLELEGGLPPILFRHNQTLLSKLSLNATDYGNPFGSVVVTVPPMDSIYLVQFSLEGVAQISHGDASFELRSGQMCVLGPGTQVRQRFAPGYKHFTVKVPRSDLETVLAEEFGYAPGRIHFSPEPVRLDGEAGALARLIRTICDEIDAGVSTYTHMRTCAAVEDTLKRMLLATIPHNHSDIYNESPSLIAPYYVRRVEGYIQANATEAISLSDMIAASGVSARSLHAGFRRYRNTTPMRYLKNYRLGLANEKLKSTQDGSISVTEIALGCGFTHLSKFSRDYRERYGELPSTALKGM